MTTVYIIDQGVIITRELVNKTPKGYRVKHVGGSGGTLCIPESKRDRAHFNYNLDIFHTSVATLDPEMAKVVVWRQLSHYKIWIDSLQIKYLHLVSQFDKDKEVEVNE